jgi:hypothetical protein
MVKILERSERTKSYDGFWLWRTRKNWLQLLAYVTGSINQELLLRNEYLVAENHILKSQIKRRLRLSDGERATLAGIAKRLGRKALQGNRLRRQTAYDPGLVSEARRSEIRRLEETRIGRPPASRCGNRRAGRETGA